MNRSSTKNKKCWNRFKSKNHVGRFGGTTISRRLSVGLPANLDKFLTARSTATNVAKAEIIRNLIIQKMDAEK